MCGARGIIGVVSFDFAALHQPCEGRTAITNAAAPLFSVRYLALTPFWTGREGKRYAAEKANYASDQRDVSNLSVSDTRVNDPESRIFRNLAEAHYGTFSIAGRGVGWGSAPPASSSAAARCGLC